MNGFTSYFFSSMTSVDLIIAETVSPTLRFISSALRLVITLSMRLSPTRTTTCAITPPSWSSVILPSSLLRADSVMRLSITVYIDFRPHIFGRVPISPSRRSPGTQARKNYVRDQSRSENKGLGAGERAIAALGFHEVSRAEGPKRRVTW